MAKLNETKVETTVKHTELELWRVRNAADCPSIKDSVPYIKANGQSGFLSLEALIEKYNETPDAVSKASGKTYRETLVAVLQGMAEPSKPELVARVMLAKLNVKPVFTVNKVTIENDAQLVVMYNEAKQGQKGRKSGGDKSIDEI